MEPFRVTFHLSRPMRVPEYPIHLDALLAWASVREAGEAGMEDPLPAQEELPLAHEGTGEDRVWCASQLLYRHSEPPFELSMIRRLERDDLAQARGRIYTGGKDSFPDGTGPYKLFLFHEPIVWTGAVVAYGVGDVPRVQALLERVHTIGKCRRLMLGRIASMSVLADTRATDAWRLRVLPVARPGYRHIEAVTRPPYWERTRRRIAYAPNDIPGDLYHA